MKTPVILLISALSVLLKLNSSGQSTAESSGPAEKEEFKVWKIPNVTNGAECYFSPDSRSLIYNGKEPGDSAYKVYTINIDGSGRKKIENLGSDACSYYNPDGKHIVWTSTRDNLDLPAGNYSDPANYPQGAEIYSSDLNGNNIVRLTNNKVYDAEVTFAPDGHKIVFGRQIEGRMDLWTMDKDGGNQKQITFTPEWQEGGALFLPDNKTIITRAWRKSEEGIRGKSMQLFTLNEDGSNLKQITTEEGTHWAPSPAPDGIHVLYVKMLPPHNFEIYLLNLQTLEEQRLTFNEAFDGFPTISPDGKTIAFSSGRDAIPGQRTLSLYLLDISPLHLSKVK